MRAAMRGRRSPGGVPHGCGVVVHGHPGHRMTRITIHCAVMSHDLMRDGKRADRKDGEQRPADEASETASLTRPVETHAVTLEPPGYGCQGGEYRPGLSPHQHGQQRDPGS